jgi:alpha-1,6-mannosyltransferase
VVGAAVLGALLLWRWGYPQAAVMAASAGSAVKVPLVLAVVVLAGLHVAAQPSLRDRVRAAGGAVAAAVVPWLLAAAVQPDALGFLAGLKGPLSGRTTYGPSTVVSEALAEAGHAVGVTVNFNSLLADVQLAAMLAAAALVVFLVLTARRRPAAETIGLTLLGAALLGPVVYPWYLTWGLFPLVAAGKAGRWICRLCVGSIFTALPGCQQLMVFMPAGAAAAVPWAVVAATVAVGLIAMLRAGREATATALG